MIFVTTGLRVMVEVKVEGIVKRYGAVEALKGISLRARSGELVCILGPSGSGKSTLLRIIAGLLMPDEGKVFFDTEDVTYLPPWKRNVGFVFQNIALFPHMTVYDNIAFGLKLRKLPKKEIDRKVKEVLKLVRLEGYEKRRPSQLSGGEAQRVAIARALVIDPKVLLFDEPLGHLDAKLRDELKFEIRRIQRETKKTAIYVTHDQAEAFAIADYIYILNRGVIEQGGTPIELYANPQSPFIADFVGSSNFLEGVVREVDKHSYLVSVDIGPLEIKVRGSADLLPNNSVVVAIRPEDIEITQSPSEVEELRRKYLNVIEGSIQRKIFVGPYLRLEVDIGYRESLKVDVYGERRFKFINLPIGTRVFIAFSRAAVFKK
ncbi:MAG: ABC transporter ATP-binding protein [Thermoprotei archaeon]|nr:MAG: ABC transporter ATP-binding protein [Thermoprotei archaeon]